MVGLAALISVPIGVGAGIFFSEWSSSPLSTISGFMNDVLTGFPTMVLGLFVFIIIVLTTRHFSAFAGGVALSFIMIPIIARTTDESLKLVPLTLREASMALGIPRWKTIFRVVIGTGKTGLLTGVLLAVARATGETAPLLLTAAASTHYATSLFTQPTASLTVLIYNYGTSPFASWQSQAWGAALVLILIMLGLNLFVKLILGRNLTEARME
jgi:phosphate transport system permease protein